MRHGRRATSDYLCDYEPDLLEISVADVNVHAALSQYNSRLKLDESLYTQQKGVDMDLGSKVGQYRSSSLL